MTASWDLGSKDIAMRQAGDASIFLGSKFTCSAWYS